jgi:hypothetical protein
MVEHQKVVKQIKTISTIENETFVELTRTTTYCKNSDVLFAALWTKLSILSQNRGNL